MTEPRFAGPLLTYIVFTAIMAAQYAICGYVAGAFGGTVVHATIAGLFVGYWIWKWTMQFVITTAFRAMATLQEQETAKKASP